MWNRFPFSIIQLLLALSLVIFNKVYGTTGVNSESWTNNQGNRLLLDEDEVAAVDHVLSQYYRFQPLNSVRHIIEEHVNYKDSLVAVLPGKCSFLVGLSVTPPARRDQQTGGGGVDALELKMNFELQCADPQSVYYYGQQYYQSEDGTRLDKQQSSAHQSPSPSDDGSFEKASMTFDLIIRLSTPASSSISSAVNQRLYEASSIQVNALKRPLSHYPFSRSLFRSSEEVSHHKQQLQVQQHNHRHLEQQQLQQQQFGNNYMQQQQVNDRMQSFQMRRSSSMYAENSQRAESYSSAYQQQQQLGAAGMHAIAADLGARPLAARRRWTPRFAKPVVEQEVKGADMTVQQDVKQSQPVSNQKQSKIVVDNNVHMDIVFKTLALSTGQINIQYGDFAIIMTRNLIQLSDQCKLAFFVRGHVLQVNMFYIGKSSRGDDVNGSSSNSLVSLLSSSAKSMSSLKSQSQSQNSQWWPKRPELSAGTLFETDGGGDGTAPFGLRRNGGSNAGPVRGQNVEDRTPRGQSPQVQSYMLRDESRLMDVSFAAAGFSFPDQRYERHYKKAFVDFIRKAANPSMQYYGLSLVQVAEEVRLKIKNFQDLANYNFDVFHDHPASLFSVDEVDQSQEQDAGDFNHDDGFRDEDRIYLGLYFMLGSDLYNHLQKLQMLDTRANADGYGAQQSADLHDSGSLDGSLNLKLLPFIASNVKWEIPTMKAKFQPLAKDSYGMRTFQNALALYYQSKSVQQSKLENARKSELNVSRRRHTRYAHNHQRAGSFDGSYRGGTDIQSGQRRGFCRNMACGIKSASIRFLNSKLGTVLVTLGIVSAAQSMCNRNG
ncbi:hypothetical protein MP228_003518 [Amoeboaphelidium protococcarum]|nr:hypothetical protein MP228_003518 [Amoeboaphelidium protococcarum]